ncbi:hypothetical protein HORIV_13240 [Vreelandella olivaria]|uniref:Uncharacterized protein n=1 Tax=Vreelandella olivaria TaxID=390919 RepID=A0ABN5WQK6_9GAMM|nr:hypothetical protein HORIV_13240 [Halomonas olivaria]
MVNAALFDAMREAEALLIERLGAVTLAELAEQFDDIATRKGYQLPTP